MSKGHPLVLRLLIYIALFTVSVFVCIIRNQLAARMTAEQQLSMYLVPR